MNYNYAIELHVCTHIKLYIVVTAEVAHSYLGMHGATTKIKQLCAHILITEIYYAYGFIDPAA